MTPVAVVQFAPKLGNVPHNLERIASGIDEAETSLVVFPECALTGYGFDSRGEADRVAEPVPGPSTERIAAACRKADRWAVVGLLERDGDRLFNAAAVIGPPGLASVYRKMHLPFLGVDRFATPGDRGFPVFDLPFGRIGVLICYDFGFPEASRVLKLAGAQAIVVPTNWPEKAEVWCDLAPFVRAQEHHVNVVTANRVGEEAGFRFLGRSRILDYAARPLAEAGAGETVIRAELDLAGADANRVVFSPGRYEVDRIAHRRPEHYGPVTAFDRGSRKRRT